MCEPVSCADLARGDLSGATGGSVEDLKEFALDSAPITGEYRAGYAFGSDPTFINGVIVAASVVDLGGIAKAVVAADKVAARAARIETHHVVPQADRRAAAARDNMKANGLDPKSEKTNKVDISGDKHDITKRDSYVQDVNGRIAGQPDAAGIKAECCRIGDELKNSTRDQLDKRYPAAP